MPDQRYYTKTNFFTINNSGAAGGPQGNGGGGGNGGEQDQMSIAEKYAHMHSQKVKRVNADGSLEEIPT